MAAFDAIIIGAGAAGMFCAAQAGQRGRRVLLIGRGAAGYRERLIASTPDIANRLFVADGLSPRAAAEHLAACDMMVQPFADGVSSRRTTVMAALASAWRGQERPAALARAVSSSGSLG